MLTELIFSEIIGTPIAKLDLPFLRLGEKITLTCTLILHKQGRTYKIELHQAGYKVRELRIENSKSGAKQIANVASVTDKEPSWKTVRGFQRPKPPKAVQPRTIVQG